MSLFVVVVTYAIAFAMVKTKRPWILAAIAAPLVANLVMARVYASQGFDPQEHAVLTVEWMITGSIAGLLAMLVPSGRDRTDEANPL